MVPRSCFWRPFPRSCKTWKIHSKTQVLWAVSECHTGKRLLLGMGCSSAHTASLSRTTSSKCHLPVGVVNLTDQSKLEAASSTHRQASSASPSLRQGGVRELESPLGNYKMLRRETDMKKESKSTGVCVVLAGSHGFILVVVAHGPGLSFHCSRDWPD